MSRPQMKMETMTVIGMETDGIADDARGVEEALEILHDEENDRDPKRVPPVAPLRGGDENGRDPAKDDAEIGNHG